MGHYWPLGFSFLSVSKRLHTGCQIQLLDFSKNKRHAKRKDVCPQSNNQRTSVRSCLSGDIKSTRTFVAGRNLCFFGIFLGQ